MLCSLISLCRGTRSCRSKFFHTSSACFIKEDFKTKALVLYEDLKEIRSSPKPAFILGVSGLLPFAGPAVYMLNTGCYLPSLAWAQMAYGASILSFLGGVRWGLTLSEGSNQSPDWFNLAYSVIPPLLGWCSLLMPTTGISSMMLMTSLMAASYFDMTLLGYPPWFKALRFILSVVAVLSLWTVFMFSFMLPEKKTEK